MWAGQQQRAKESALQLQSALSVAGADGEAFVHSSSFVPPRQVRL